MIMAKTDAEDKNESNPELEKKMSKKYQEEMKKFREKQLKIANKYTDELLKRYKKFIKAVVLFGSFSRGDFQKKSDIDMLVVIDDTAARFSPEMHDNFDMDIRDIAKSISKDITVQPSWTLTEFWDMARIGHPLLYTIVRDGWALFDTGFFVPVRKLLEAGKIPMTLEAVEQFMHGAPKKIERAKTTKLYLIAEDVYYAMLNSAQAVLMYTGVTPPAPKNTPKVMEETLLHDGLLEKEYSDMMQDVIDFRKNVEHREIKDVEGAKVDEYINKAQKFVDRMEQLLTQLEKKKKESSAIKNYEVMIQASVSALKNLNKLPDDPKLLPKVIKEELIDAKRVSPNYADTFRRVVSMRKLVDDNRISEVPEKDIQLAREYVRRFVQDLSPLINKDICNTKKHKSAKKKINKKGKK